MFLKLGLTSFGGPTAHIGFFRTEFVERRRWLSDHQFAHLLAVCQFLPGPASSQLGFCIGLQRAGWLGALGAFIGFTLPSAIVLVAFAVALPLLSSTAGEAVIHGLKLVACAVVADALIGMGGKLCPDWRRRLLALVSALVMIAAASSLMQLGVVLVAGLVGTIILKDLPASDRPEINVPYGHRLGGALIAVFFAIFVALSLGAASQQEANAVTVAEAFYRAGALVFGGGHVVLPLLENSTVGQGWLSPEKFLAGYGAAQAIPGPMFSFAAYLGSVISTPLSSMSSAGIALLFMFLPGFLLVAGILPFWSSLSRHTVMSRAVGGVNAAVVGLLAAALYTPIITSGIARLIDLAIVLVGFILLFRWRLSPLWVVFWSVAASLLAMS
ncbi:chromate transporter [Litorivivens lipolytica]|uniref:Chromate transporter n=1 Tax=Litorivivens lipolytica TaxID=1524264 RepID=A0A7W4W1W9_9GAMM|nr:chromate transporter [Litorivivens lipolytica]